MGKIPFLQEFIWFIWYFIVFEEIWSLVVNNFNVLSLLHLPKLFLLCFSHLSVLLPNFSVCQQFRYFFFVDALHVAPKNSFRSLFVKRAIEPVNFLIRKSHVEKSMLALCICFSLMPAFDVGVALCCDLLVICAGNDGDGKEN